LVVFDATEDADCCHVIKPELCKDFPDVFLEIKFQKDVYVRLFFKSHFSHSIQKIFQKYLEEI
jgi:hypothetical protein